MSGRKDFRAGLSLIILGATGLADAFRKFKTRRSFADLATSEIAAAAQGYAELSGFAWAEAPASDLEGKPVAFLRWQLQEKVGFGRNAKWLTRAQSSGPKGFVLHDRSGAAWVDLQDRAIDEQYPAMDWAKLTTEQRDRFLGWLSTRVENFPPDSFFSTSFRVCIEKLPLGGPVVAQGNFLGVHEYDKPVLPGIAAYKIRYEQLLANPSLLLALADVNSDGVLDEQEYQLGLAYAAESTVKRIANGGVTASAGQTTVPIMGVLANSPDHALVVADTHLKYYLRRLSRWWWAQVVGAALLAAVGICLLAYDLQRKD